MSKVKTDGRIRRTQAALREALLGLIVERGFEKTSVQDILDRTGVGRATFYAHYRNKEDLLQCSLDALREYLTEEWKSAGGAESAGRLGYSLAFFRHVDGHRRLYRAVVGRLSGAIVMREMRRMLADLVKADLAVRGKRGQDETRIDLAAQYIVGAMLAVVTWWLDRSVKLSPEEVDLAFRKMTVSALQAGLEVTGGGGGGVS